MDTGNFFGYYLFSSYVFYQRTTLLFSLSCVVRKAGEFHAIPDDFAPTAEEIVSNQIVSVNKLFEFNLAHFQHFFPLKYSTIHSIAKVFMAALFDFGNATFEDFRSLLPKDKVSKMIPLEFRS